MKEINKQDIEKSNSWPIVEAKKILKERKSFIEKKGKIVLQTGYGPSGLPPIFIIGIKVIAITIIPIPPNHWSIALQLKIALGVSDKLLIIVAPVVVIPDILSKKASVKDRFKSENINGIEPNIATPIHDLSLIHI